MITIYRISGIVKEVKNPYVFCWYKESFMLLGGFGGGDFGIDYKIDIFKLNEQEVSNLMGYINKVKIVKTLEQQ